MWYKIGLSRMVVRWKMGEEDPLVEVSSYIMANQPGELPLGDFTGVTV